MSELRPRAAGGGRGLARERWKGSILPSVHRPTHAREVVSWSTCQTLTGRSRRSSRGGSTPPFPINLYDCLVKNPLGQITTFSMSALVAGIGVLAERYTLMLGIHHTDMELRPVLQKSMETLEDVVNFVVESFTDDRRFRLLLPFKDTQRSDVIQTGLRLGVNYVNTWSCHENGDTPCNLCEGCEERREAFQLAGVKDPQVGKRIEVPVHANRISARI
jgi:hypothetical protein